LERFRFDLVRDGDREKLFELQKRSDCEFPLPDPLSGFVVRDGEKLVAWAGWEIVAEVMGVMDPSLTAKEKVRIWANLHKPIESQVIRKGITVGYVQVKKESHRFASILNLLGWKFCQGLWLRREAGVGLNPTE
jgi:hypothetical protein